VTDGCLDKLETVCASDKQTIDRHMKDGILTLQRKNLHDKIIATVRESSQCVVNKNPKRRPIAILMGGSPGAGKTTFLKKNLSGLIQPGSGVLMIAADEIREMLPEYKGWNAGATYKEASLIVERMISEIGVPCSADIIFDGTMTNPSRYQALVAKLKSEGYYVVGFVVNVDMDVSLARMKKRYQETGRYVPRFAVQNFYGEPAQAAVRQVLGMLDAHESIQFDSDGRPISSTYSHNAEHIEEIKRYFGESKAEGDAVPAFLRRSQSNETPVKKPTEKPVKNAPTKPKPVAAPAPIPTPTVQTPPPPSSGPTDADLDRVEAMMAKLEQTLSSIAA
jgi:predicted ABC-type ATPase